MKSKDGWSPYLAGAFVGVLAIALVWGTSQYLGKTNMLGASTTFVRAAGALERCVIPEHVSANAYFSKEKVKIDWQFLLVIGIFFGALAGSIMDGSYKRETVPPVWRERFGGSSTKRAVAAFIGGIIALFGARMADGCPSGHGLSGLMPLSVSSFVALGLFFAGGALAAHILYRRNPS